MRSVFHVLPWRDFDVCQIWSDNTARIMRDLKDLPWERALPENISDCSRFEAEQGSGSLALTRAPLPQCVAGVSRPTTRTLVPSHGCFYISAMKSKNFRRGVWLGALVMALAAPLYGQADLRFDPTSAVRTRAELADLLASYELVLSSPAYSEAIKQETSLLANRIRDRLTNGDFKLGDAVVLRVEGEPSLPATVPVLSGASGPILSLPVFGEVPLHGVLRSEVEARITESLSQFIRDPVVQAEGLMRISVQGSVGTPGFFTVAADMLVSEVLMAAGGPAQDADLDDITIGRGSELLMAGEEMREALRLGRTLDQLNLQAGDELVVGADTGGGWGSLGVIIGTVSSVVLILTRIRR